MCDICRTAKRFPSVYHSLEFLAVQMKVHGELPSCVDLLIGELVGIKATDVDRKMEADWEQANHGQTSKGP